MIRTRLFLALLFSVVLATFFASCSHLDVRMGMGDGSGVGLSYRIVGKGSPLVVIHDGPGYEKSLMYGGFDNLASDLRVIYYDQRGCGRSEPLSPVTSSTIADNIEDLEALRRYFPLEKFSIAAHGWGAVIALEYARKYQDRIDSIVLLTPISPFSPQPHDETIIDKLPAEVQQSVAEVMSQPTMTMLERKERIMKLVMPSLFHRSEASRSLNLRRLRYSADVNIRLSDELGKLNLFPNTSGITLSRGSPQESGTLVIAVNIMLLDQFPDVIYRTLHIAVRLECIGFSKEGFGNAHRQTEECHCKTGVTPTCTVTDNV